LREGRKLSLKDIESPILVFASMGDNITPAQQALNWIPRVYSSVEDIKRHGQVIVYIVHEEIGHLGIFVAGSIAKKEHNEIIGNFDMIDCLPPGLYEMVIDGDVASGKFESRFEPRAMADIAAYDDGIRDETDFSVVAKVSEANDNLYQLLARPWVKLWTTELSAEFIRHLHPLRLQRYLLADINPLMRPLKNTASVVRRNRKPAGPDNPFTELEKAVSDYVEGVLDIYRDYRDLHQEEIFQQIYGNGWLRSLFPPVQDEPKPAAAGQEHPDHDRRLAAMERGGVAEGLIRIYMAAAATNQGIKRKHFEVAREIAATHRVLSKLSLSQFKKMMREQSAILQADEERALQALATLIKNKDDRMEALSIARRLFLADGVYNDEEKVLLENIRKGLRLEAV